MRRIVVVLQIVLLGWLFPLATPAEASFCGKYRGVVLNIVDPEQRGRVQVIVPQVSGELPAWALPNAPFGRIELPPAGGQVWVAFEDCDPQFPIWEGSPVVQCSADKQGIPRKCETP